jgi:small subunit ribosomal protein S2
MALVEVKELLDSGVHFGHLTRKWDPNMAPYIYMERNGIHIINLYKTAAKLEEASEALSKIAASGRKILFVATKKQAKDIVSEKAGNVNMPYITERWPGGMLTNFVTIRKAVKKMASIDRMKKDGTFLTLSKKERLQVDRLRAKLEKNLGSISEMTRLPAALFVIDIKREHIAIKEAQKLNIPIFAMVDTNSDPRQVDYVIPANDDASKSIEKILTNVTNGIAEGLAQRKAEKDTKDAEKAEAEAPKAEKTEAEAPKAEKTVEATKAEKTEAEATKAEKTEKTEKTEAKATKAEKTEKTEAKATKAEKTEAKATKAEKTEAEAPKAEKTEKTEAEAPKAKKATKAKSTKKTDKTAKAAKKEKK